ncbi:uncharacterized protein LOC126398400 [Epinephelus moara]|uniref:uncharacterized protein LOC126398400 n=1 Tax=Epinephelus moara TaxID=300413 RepID=UPI00214E094E|nr:uncharacterized protein LOC126398400 [Epinephelus moara]
MSKEGKREYQAWYETVRHGNFEKEAIRYCQNDVDILGQACGIFRKGYINETGVDPFSCATIASACMKVFRTNFLCPDTLAIQSPDDYRRRRKAYSNAGVQWLEWVSHTEGVFIQHALNAGEKQIGRYFVDTCVEVRGVKTAWEFLGCCCYHGGPSSFQSHDTCPLTGPLGHPEIVHRDFKEPQNYFGLIRAVVYPPRGLFFPVLPYKTATGKLVFTLCRTCDELNFQAGSCTDDYEARALMGVWVTPEFNKALESGYRLGKITEVWHFDRHSNDIFVEYMHAFLKGKQEASGYPAEASEQESREKYIADYRANQGILLHADKIQPNTAKRQVAKLCLNSLWGRFAQRSNLNQTVLVREPEEFFSYMFSEKHKVKYFFFLNETTVLIQWCHGDLYIAPPNKTDNVFIAAFTTAYGRLKLYDYLQQMQNRVLYLDTDSLIYVAKEGETRLKLGNYLGDLTDELGGNTIRDFAAAGPTSYAYLTKNKRAVLRLKGITQTHKCQNQF